MPSEYPKPLIVTNPNEEFMNLGVLPWTWRHPSHARSSPSGKTVHSLSAISACRRSPEHRPDGRFLRPTTATQEPPLQLPLVLDEHRECRKQTKAEYEQLQIVDHNVLQHKNPALPA